MDRRRTIAEQIIGFQILEYIQCTGTQYINTGITETDDTAIDLHLSNDRVTNNYLYGGSQSGSMMYNGLYSNSALEYNYKTIKYTAATDIVMSQSVSGTTNTIIINGVTTTASTGTSNKTTIYIFACNGGGRLYSKMKIYYFKIKQGGRIVRDFVPMLRISDSKPGLYDKISKTFFVNAGSGEFSYG